MIIIYTIITIITITCIAIIIYELNRTKKINKTISTYQEVNQTEILIITDNNFNYPVYNLKYHLIPNIYIINIDDYDGFIHFCNNVDTKNIDIIISAKGGFVSSNDVIISLLDQLGKKNININIHIYKYAMSASTLIVFASNHIYMDTYDFLTPTDPQITLNNDTYQSYDLLNNLNSNNIKFEDNLLVNSTKRYHDMNIKTMKKLLRKHMIKFTDKKFNELLKFFCSGEKLHLTPIYKNQLKNMGLKIKNKNDTIKIISEYIFDIIK